MISISSSDVVWDTHTLVRKGPGAAKISSALSTLTDLGDSEHMTIPIASAPASSARTASAGRVMPQIFTRIQIPPAFLRDLVRT
jgi:hypothetical protein